jgi:hypothetical protein
MISTRAFVSRSVLAVVAASAAICLIAGTASATGTVPFSCPATITIDLPHTSTGFPAGWSPARSTLTVVNAWVSTPGVLACAYGGNADSPSVTSIYKLTTATCTGNTAHTGFDCDRAP